MRAVGSGGALCSGSAVVQAIAAAPASSVRRLNVRRTYERRMGGRPSAARSPERTAASASSDTGTSP